jgi:hypothetical protein
LAGIAQPIASNQAAATIFHAFIANSPVGFAL